MRAWSARRELKMDVWRPATVLTPQGISDPTQDVAALKRHADALKGHRAGREVPYQCVERGAVEPVARNQV